MDAKEAVAIIEGILGGARILSVTYFDAEIAVPMLPQGVEDKLYTLITDAHFEVDRLQEGEYRYWDIKYKGEYLCMVFFDYAVIYER